jgi:hypothetical protein
MLRCLLGELRWTVGELEQGPTYKCLKNEGGVDEIRTTAELLECCDG